MSTTGWFVIIGGGALAAVTIANWNTAYPPKTGEQIMADIRKNCEREFGTYDKEKIDSCVIAISIQKLRDAENMRMKRAYDSSR